MRTMPEIAAITAHITSPSCAIWPLISCPRNPPRAPCVSKSNGPVGRTPISQSSSPKSEVRLPCIILFLSDTVGGRIHDKRLAEATPYPLPAGSRLLQDLGFMAFPLPQVEILMPRKKPPGAELSPAQQRANPLPPIADRACQQQCQALSCRQRPDPP